MLLEVTSIEYTIPFPILLDSTVEVGNVVAELCVLCYSGVFDFPAIY